MCGGRPYGRARLRALALGRRCISQRVSCGKMATGDWWQARFTISLLGKLQTPNAAGGRVCRSPGSLARGLLALASHLYSGPGDNTYKGRRPRSAIQSPLYHLALQWALA